MQSVQQFKQSTDQFELDFQLEKEALAISLRTHHKSFKSQFTTQTLPPTVKDLFRSVEVVFEVLKFKGNYEVYHSTGKLSLKNIFSNEKKTCILQLQEIVTNTFQKIQESITQLHRKIANLQKKNEASQLKITEKDSKITKNEQQNQLMKTKMNKLIQCINTHDKKFTQFESKLKLKDSEKKQFENKVSKLQSQIISLKANSNVYKPQASSNTSTNSLPFASLIKDIQANNTFELYSPYAKYFKVVGNQITFEGTDREDTQFLMRKKISMMTTFRFFVKIVKSRNRDIMVGIVDRSKQQSARKSWNSGNAVCYRGKTGKIYYGDGAPKFKDSGIGFYEGQKVTIDVNLSKGSIKWSVGMVERASLITSMLMEYQRDFAPFVEIGEYGDSVQMWYE